MSMEPHEEWLERLGDMNEDNAENYWQDEGDRGPRLGDRVSPFEEPHWEVHVTDRALAVGAMVVAAAAFVWGWGRG